MKNKLSWRHHYIPQFYLKGFTNENNEFAIYDKQQNKIKDKLFSPKTHFFEKNRNIIEIKGEKSDRIETELYQEIDNDISNLFEEIHNKDADFLTPYNLYTLKLFISFLFWRVPKNDELINEIIDKYDFEELGFKIQHKTSKKEASEEIKRMFKNDPAVRKMYSFILPFKTFNVGYNENEEEMWKAISDNTSDAIRLTSDAPIITLKKDVFYDKTQKIIFPVTSNKLLFYGETAKQGKLSPNFYIDADVAAIHNATRYVCGPNKDYLEKVVQLYNLRVEFNKTDEIIPDLFEHLK
ncbi:MAG: DUF4238 domain-containing protein [Flavobacteriales bacterium]|nr:DUF4238 domain-containing protein [Flavobacteriales bacterium]